MIAFWLVDISFAISWMVLLKIYINLLTSSAVLPPRLIRSITAFLWIPLHLNTLIGWNQPTRSIDTRDRLVDRYDVNWILTFNICPSSTLNNRFSPFQCLWCCRSTALILTMNKSERTRPIDSVIDFSQIWSWANWVQCGPLLLNKLI